MRRRGQLREAQTGRRAATLSQSSNGWVGQKAGWTGKLLSREITQNCRVGFHKAVTLPRVLGS